MRLSGRHFSRLLQAAPDAADQGPGNCCRVYYAKGIHTENGNNVRTRFACYSCPSVPGLHPERYFELYHTKEDLHKIFCHFAWPYMVTFQYLFSQGKGCVLF